MRKFPVIPALCLAACVWGTAQAQTTGVSHPDEVIVSDSDTPPPATRYTTGATTRTITVTSSAAPAPPTGGAASSGFRPDASTPAHDASDIDAGIVTRVPGRSDELPEGTLLKMRIHQSLSTISTRPGSLFDGDLVAPVERDGKVLIPAGSIVSGRVTAVHSGKRISGAASIHLLPTRVTLPDGTHYAVHAVVIDTSLYKVTKVDREGTILRRDHPKETLGVLGASTGTGAIAGGVMGGPPGALVGAGVGAGVGTVVWLKQDRQEDIPADTKIIFSLISPIEVGSR
jgi:hypothetical protein